MVGQFWENFELNGKIGEISCTLAFALNDEMSFVDAESHRKDVYGLETHFKRIIDTYEKV